MKRIDFEAHYYTEGYLNALSENRAYPRLVEDEQIKGRRLWYAPEVGQPFAQPLVEKLMDLGEGRLKTMDECGIDVQVLSLSAPGLEQLDPAVGSSPAGPSHCLSVAPITSWPASSIRAAATELSTPPDIATRAFTAASR